jgi:site-specific DNA recombinase
VTAVLPQTFQVLKPEGQPPAADPDVPQHPVAITRISEARDDDTKGVERQEDRLLKLNARLGWGPLTVVVENDISGYKRRKVTRADGTVEYRVFRPGLRQIMAWLDGGVHDGLLALDSDRAFRDPYDLEDLAHIVRSKTPPIPQDSVTGSLRLTTDADLTTTRILTAVANKSSMDTARRVADARLDIAMAGRWGGGRRPFGFGVEVEHPTKPGVKLLDVSQLRPAEAEWVVKGCKAVLSGVSLREQLKDLRENQVSTVTGKPWTSLAWRDILLRPRNAGLVLHQGKIVENVKLAGPAGETPIVDVATWEAVRAILTSPHRRTSPGPAPRWLGSGLYLCGHPDCLELDPRPTLRVGTGAGNRPGRQAGYGCKRKAHMRRQAGAMDEFVQDMVVARLANPDAVRLLTPKVRVDTAALNVEAAGLRAKITEAGDLWEAKVFGAAEYTVRRRRLEAQLAEVTGKLNAASGVDPLAGVAGNPDAKRIWAELPLSRRRAILRNLVTVTVGPAPRARPGWKPGKGAKYFSTEGIVLDWHTFG